MMIRSRLFFVHALFSLISIINNVACRLAERVAEPVMLFIRCTPVAAVIALLPRFKIVAFRVIDILKPVYRDSYDTHGLSISGRFS